MIRPAIKSDVLSIAQLHRKTLTSSFLAKLGIGFLNSLYVFLIKKELVILYAEDENIKGFVSFSANSSGMMKRFLVSCPVCIFKLMGILVSSPILLKRFIETFTAPFKSKTSQSAKGNIKLPDAELLSISVDPGCQQSGIGSQLLKALEEELLIKGIRKYKVIAGVSLEGANKFYNRNGFTMVSQVMIHGNELSNIYIKEI
jgi:ribosomal protein S18 acetylase RimI-like enzyme